jgi:hypothetical protein
MIENNEQLELPLPPVEDNNIYFEDLTLTTDTMLARAMGKYRSAFVIGIPNDGLPEYLGSHSDIVFWMVALERAKAFMMKCMDE